MIKKQKKNRMKTNEKKFTKSDNVIMKYFENESVKIRANESTRQVETSIKNKNTSKSTKTMMIKKK